jgi:hypothetical protein
MHGTSSVANALRCNAAKWNSVFKFFAAVARYRF